MLGGINNGLFFSGFGGFFVIAIVIIPILKWSFPKNNGDRQSKLRK